MIFFTYMKSLNVIHIWTMLQGLIQQNHQGENKCNTTSSCNVDWNNHFYYYFDDLG